MNAEKIRLAREFVLLLGALIAVFQLVFSNEARRHDWLTTQATIQEIKQELNQSPKDEQEWTTRRDN